MILKNLMRFYVEAFVPKLFFKIFEIDSAAK